MKKVTGQVKLQIPAGKANPAPPIGPALGQRGLNIMEFCKAFNAKTAQVRVVVGGVTDKEQGGGTKDLRVGLQTRGHLVHEGSVVELAS